MPLVCVPRQEYRSSARTFCTTNGRRIQVRRTSHAATNVRSERKFQSGPYLATLFGAEAPVDAYLEQQICARIKQARVEAGFTQEDMAALLNVTTRAWQNYEHIRVPFRRLAEIAKLSGVTQEWLLHGDAPESQTLADRLRELEATVAESVALMREALELLREAQRRDASSHPSSHRARSR